MSVKMEDYSSEDVEDLLLKIEDSLNIEFKDNELAHIRTLGELCDYIVNKMELEQKDDCTSQQAFYKLRQATSASLGVNSKDILPHTELTGILPRKNRRKNVRKIESILGFNLPILHPPEFVTLSLAFLLLVSIVAMFFNAVAGIAGIVFIIATTKIANKYGKELKAKTIREVVELMTRERYIHARRYSNTYNRNEIENVVFDMFRHHLLIDEAELTRDIQLAQ